jgi:hypothetical protein
VIWTPYASGATTMRFPRRCSIPMSRMNILSRILRTRDRSLNPRTGNACQTALAADC